jgi:hypothetical protein
MNGEPALLVTHPSDGGTYDAGLILLQTVGSQPDLDIYFVFQNQIYVPVHIVPGHAHEYMREHSMHRGSDFMAFQGFRFQLS